MKNYKMKHTFIAFILSVAPFLSTAQNDSLPGLEAYFTAIIVQDMDISIDWYTSVLGFDVLNNMASAERGFKQANLTNGSVLLELIELKSAVSSTELLADYPPKTRMTGFFKFGFAVSNFDDWIDHLIQKEVDFYGDVVEDPISGKRMVIITDPDGNRIQIFEK